MWMAGCGWCGPIRCSASATGLAPRSRTRGARSVKMPTSFAGLMSSQKSSNWKVDDARAFMTRKQRRLTLIGAGLGVLGLAAGLVLYALNDAIVFFNSPTDVLEKHVAPGARIRLGGLVKPGTLMRGDNLHVRFEVTDGKTSVPVTYVGVLPDLFREGQGVVTEGALEPGGTFRAETILAKHDETYMPKEVADALKKQGHWKTDAGYGLAGSSKEAPK